jgi:hypothetical protein
LVAEILGHGVEPARRYSPPTREDRDTIRLPMAEDGFRDGADADYTALGNQSALLVPPMPRSLRGPPTIAATQAEHI